MAHRGLLLVSHVELWLHNQTNKPKSKQANIFPFCLWHHIIKFLSLPVVSLCSFCLSLLVQVSTLYPKVIKINLICAHTHTHRLLQSPKPHIKIWNTHKSLLIKWIIGSLGAFTHRALTIKKGLFMGILLHSDEILRNTDVFFESLPM